MRIIVHEILNDDPIQIASQLSRNGIPGEQYWTNKHSILKAAQSPRESVGNNQRGAGVRGSVQSSQIKRADSDFPHVTLFALAEFLSSSTQASDLEVKNEHAAVVGTTALWNSRTVTTGSIVSEGFELSRTSHDVQSSRDSDLDPPKNLITGRGITGQAGFRMSRRVLSK